MRRKNTRPYPTLPIPCTNLTQHMAPHPWPNVPGGPVENGRQFTHQASGRENGAGCRTFHVPSPCMKGRYSGPFPFSFGGHVIWWLWWWPLDDVNLKVLLPLSLGFDILKSNETLLSGLTSSLESSLAASLAAARTSLLLTSTTTSNITSGIHKISRSSSNSTVGYGGYGCCTGRVRQQAGAGGPRGAPQRRRSAVARDEWIKGTKQAASGCALLMVCFG
jgi:hypothetical protein